MLKTRSVSANLSSNNVSSEKLTKDADKRRPKKGKDSTFADQVRHHKEEHQRMEDEKKAFEVEVTI
jgi:hypothetical protein